jgi:phosphohistidine swiveling domain-containing protein
MSDSRRQFALIHGGTGRVTLAEVGGKGYSLIRMAEAALPVPPGAVLTTEFFAPWFEAIRASSTWTTLANANPDAWPALSGELKSLCSDLALTSDQRETLEELRRRLPAPKEGELAAVRSSSTEEDLVSASFAGGYETKLGVRWGELEHALQHCFSSIFDLRVFVYKCHHGFDVLSPRIAVVVQQQIASEVAGVGFSLNPLTNDYDEAVIDANWGLGESVVAGLASPDHFVIDKVSGKLIQKELGAKQVSIWLGRGGGIVERQRYRSTELTLSEVQLAELVDVLGRIEDLFGRPMDVEWAYAHDRLHVLQARPITTYIPLPSEMVTNPGERRRLYADAALSQGFTTNEPISPLGLAWIVDILYSSVLKRFAGVQDFTPAGGLVFAAGCRFYMNLSNTMWMGMTPKVMAKSAAATDALLAAIIATIDPKRYRAAKRPPWLRLGLLFFIPRALWALRGLFWNLLWSVFTPGRARRRYQRNVDDFEAKMTENLDYDLPLVPFTRTHTETLWPDMFNVTLPALFAGLASPSFLIPRKLRKEGALADELRRGFVGNLVVEQAVALFRLTKGLGLADFDDIEELAARIEKREMPFEFMSEWEAFLRRFGWRGPHEMDPASPRYADDPKLALEPMSFMAVEGGLDPEVAHQHSIEARRNAYEELLRCSGWLRRVLLRHTHRLVELFGGTRDTPKYHAVLLSYAIRKRALIEGKHLVEQGRLDAAEEVFDLTFRDLEAASRHPDLDLRGLRRERTRFAKLSAHVTEFPQVIDSRGRILRPPRRGAKPGELLGMAVSPGAVTGPVKVLRSPRDKPVEKGDVLVAYTTDPGWTPLFVNAAAVVLEVGGILQHGAVIAREYGKPCVAGVDRVMSRLRDGQTVEVDGTAGVIRLLGEVSA